MLRNFVLLFLCVFSLNSYASDEKKSDSLDIISALAICFDIADSTPSPFINPKLFGKIVTIEGVKYEIRSFSFEDTKHILPKDMTFLEYIKTYKLEDFKAVAYSPIEGINFVAFNSRKIEDNQGIYFNLAFKKVNK